MQKFAQDKDLKAQWQILDSFLVWKTAAFLRTSSDLIDSNVKGIDRLCEDSLAAQIRKKNWPGKSNEQKPGFFNKRDHRLEKPYFFNFCQRNLPSAPISRFLAKSPSLSANFLDPSVFDNGKVESLWILMLYLNSCKRLIIIVKFIKIAAINLHI